MFMRCGTSIDEALRLAAADLHQLEDPYRGEVNIVAVDRAGRHGAAATVPGKSYIVMTEGMSDYVELEREYVPPP
jgi:isoaspartyl peptidase/L-asparaginase-like protein (Ntn-hydrolase superfamily)